MFIENKNKTTEKGKWTQSLSTPSQEVICNRDLLLKKKYKTKNSFLQHKADYMCFGQLSHFYYFPLLFTFPLQRHSH